MEQTLIKQVFDSFDIIYILMINIVTYFLIKTADYFNGDKKVPVLTKRIFLILATVIMFVFINIMITMMYLNLLIALLQLLLFGLGFLNL